MRVTCAQTPSYVTKAGLCPAIRLTIDFGFVPEPTHSRGIAATRYEHGFVGREREGLFPSLPPLN
jgi:hypothetical protein